MRKNRKRLIWIGVSISIIVLFVRNCTYSENTNRVFIKDKEGRSLILHGVNVNADAKSDSLRVGWPMKEDYAKLSEKWGLNLVRYLVLWDGIEPTQGEYDRAYFDRIRERLDWCHELGLYVVLDMHQDLYALRYGGDGAPDWAIIDDGEPFEMQTPWELNYRQPAVIASINNFWDKSRGHGYLQEHYIKAVVELVKEFKDHPSVIGYDLYNEPTMATKELFAFEKRYLQPFYEDIIPAIRKVDNENWIFYEPTALGANQGLKSRLDVLEDPREGEARLAYFPHIYTLDLDIRGKYIGFPIFLKNWAANRNREIKKQNAPMLVGEFGLDLKAEGSEDYLKEVMNMLDKTSSGWAYWAYMENDRWTTFTEDETMKAKTDIVFRPYPKAVAGKPISYGFDHDSKEFWLNFESDPKIKAPTEIYLPENHFPTGYELSIEQDDGLWESNWIEEKRILQIFKGDIDKSTVKIRIYPKKVEVKF